MMPDVLRGLGRCQTALREPAPGAAPGVSRNPFRDRFPSAARQKRGPAAPLGWRLMGLPSPERVKMPPGG